MTLENTITKVLNTKSSIEDGELVIYDRTLRENDGAWSAWIKPSSHRDGWVKDDQFEIKHPGVLAKVKDLVDNTSLALDPTEGELATKERALDSFDSTSFDSLPDSVWKEFLFDLMKERFKGKPAYLATWTQKVQESGIQEKLTG